MTEQSSIQRSAVVIPSGHGEIIALGGSLHSFKLTSANTEGQFALMEATIQPHTLVMPHRHTFEDEVMIAQEGVAGMRVGDQEFEAGPGSYIFVPRGIPHAIWNATNAPIRGISIFTPAGLEAFFVEMGAVYKASNPPDFARLGAISRQYGIVNHMEWVPEISAKYGVKLG